MDKNLYLRQLKIGPMENFIYLIGDRETRECMMVDPAWDVHAVLEAARQDDMNVNAALITHTHYDHCNGVEELLRQTKSRIYVHKKEAGFLKGMQSDVVPVQGGDTIKIGRYTLTFIHTPGHTPGSQCFMLEDHLVSGDTLFINACGRCDLAGGSPEDMYESLQTLSRVGDDVILLPGHNYGDVPTSTIGREKEQNPYYQLKTLDDFLGLRMG